MRIHRSRWLLGLAAAGLVASGCGGGGGSDLPPGVYSVALTEPDKLIPGNTTSSYSFQVIDALFERLTKLDPETGQPVMNEARSITSDDQKVWTIELKPGRTFHNGEPVTAQSYADAWNAAAYGPNGWKNNYYFENFQGYDALNPDEGEPDTDELSGVDVLDERTLRVTLDEPFSQFPLTLAYQGFAPLPEVAFEDLDAFNLSPVGNGPFRMDGEWERNRSIELTRYDDYKGDNPAKSEGIHFQIYANREAAYTDLLAGRVDLLTTIPAAKVPEAKRVFGDRFASNPSGTVDYLAFPLYDERFEDENLRKAISMAIDRKAIVDAVYNGAYEPAGSLLASTVPGHRDDACGEACTYQPGRAKRLFDAAGGFDGTLELYFSNADPTYEQWMTAVANQLKTNLGITDIQFEKVPAADYLDELEAHNAPGPYRQNWIMDYPSPENFLSAFYSEDNRLGYDNERVRDLVDKGNRAENLQASIPFYQRAEDAALADLPNAPLWYWQDQAGYSERISNVVIDPYVSGARWEQITVE